MVVPSGRCWAGGGVVAAGATVLTAGPVADAAAGTTGRAAVGKPRPAAYSPHSAWLNDGTSPNFGWLVNSAETSSCEPSTSSTKPCSAFFGPTSTKTRAPASYSVRRPLTNCTGEATCRPRTSSIVSTSASGG